MSFFVYIFFLALLALAPEQAFAQVQAMRFCPGSGMSNNIVVASSSFSNLISTLFWGAGLFTFIRAAWLIFRGLRTPSAAPVSVSAEGKRDMLIFCGIGCALILMPLVCPGALDSPADTDNGLTMLAVFLCLLTGFVALVRGLVLASRIWTRRGQSSVWKRALLHGVAGLVLFSFPYIQMAMQGSISKEGLPHIDAATLNMPPPETPDGFMVAADDGLGLHYYLPRNPVDAEDAVQLASLYSAGLAVPPDDGEALRWYRYAADKGNAQAQRSLAEIYAGGRGAPKDIATAFKLYRAAALQGDLEAQSALSGMYAYAQGTVKDNVEANFWYLLWKKNSAASDSIAQDWPVTAAQRAAIERRVKAWKPVPGPEPLRARAEKGDAQAQLELAFLYARGQGVAADAAMTLKWMRKAADQGLPRAQSFLGYLYENGNGVKKDYAEAYFWYKLASRQPAQDAIDVPMGKSDMATILTLEQKEAADARIKKWQPVQPGRAK